MLATNIKTIRTFHRFTQKQFGELFNLTRSNVDSYERGNASPSREVMKAIADHYGLTVDILLFTDLKLNPTLLDKKATQIELGPDYFENLIKVKDELIFDQRQQIAFLQQQIQILTEKLH